MSSVIDSMPVSRTGDSEFISSAKWIFHSFFSITGHTNDRQTLRYTYLVMRSHEHFQSDKKVGSSC